MIRSLSVGIEFADETIRLSIVDRQLNRFQVRDLLQISERSSKPMPELKKQVAEFLARHKAAGCPAVLLLPRQEIVMRQLVLPLDAEANLAKVVEYQLVNLLPSEDALVAYDYAAFKQEGSPGSLRVSVFLVLREVLDRYLELCQELGIHLARVVPAAVALANYFWLLEEHFKVKSALFLRFGGQNCEVVGVLEQRVLIWRDGPLPAEVKLLDFLKTEADYFRSQARLPEDAPLQVFLSGGSELPDPSSSSQLNLRCQMLTQPVNFGVGMAGRVITPREMQDHFGCLVAGMSALRKRVPEPVNLLPAEKRIRNSTWQLVPTYALVAANCVLILALVLRGRIQQSMFSAQLSQEVSRIEPEVKKVRGVEEELAQLTQRAAVVADFKEKNALVLAALVELSEILPKDTFVGDLIFKDGVFEINGLSGQAAALPQIIENSPLFKGAEFVSAITRSSVAPDKEGYRLRMKLELPTKAEVGVSSQTPTQAISAIPKVDNRANSNLPRTP